MPTEVPVPKAALLRQIRRYQKLIRQAAARRARHVPTSTRRPKLRGSKAPEELGRLLLLLAQRLALHPSWRNYTWRDDLVAAALPALIKACRKYDTSRKTSPFSYLTMTAWREFTKELQAQKRRGITGAADRPLEVLAFPRDPVFGMFEHESGAVAHFFAEGHSGPGLMPAVLYAPFQRQRVGVP